MSRTSSSTPRRARFTIAALIAAGHAAAHGSIACFASETANDLVLFIPDVELGIVRLVQFLEFLQPLFAGLLRCEAPLLAMVVPIVRVQLLRPAPVFRGELVLPLLVEPDRELETGLALHLRRRARLHAPGEF